MTPRIYSPWRYATRAVTALAFALLTTAAVAAQSVAQPSLGLPIECVPNQTCWIANYVDHDPTAGVRDYMCGKATYNIKSRWGNAHKGTDFAIRDAAAMRAGVPVLAAAGGRVAGVRDEIPDNTIGTPIDTAALDGKDCGNGVAIDHGGGWITQYCHMRLGSIAVKKGQEVAKGQPLGLVGLSGFTSFPHVHIEVFHDGAPVDPFSGVAGGPACGPGTAPLWDAATMAELPYVLGEIYNIGFASEKPSREKARDGDYRADTISRQAPVVVLWTEIFNVRAGDRISLKILEPNAQTLHEYTKTIDRTHRRYWAFAGERLRGGAWPAGTYTGAVRIEHADGKSSARTATVTLR